MRNAYDAAAALVSSDELLRHTMELVRLPSYFGLPNQEQRVSEYLAALFAAEGIEHEIIALGGGRYNIAARLNGIGGGKTLMLNGHMDTVPPYGMDCATDPVIVGDRVMGRGVSDMKGPLCAMAGALIALKRSGVKLRGDLVFTGVADEEERSIGAVDLIKSGIKADGCIVGEPTGMKHIFNAQKGLEWFSFDFTGLTVHGASQDKGVNAILKAVEFINAIESELRPKLDRRFLPAIGKSTINIGVIKGGTQLSTVAGECQVMLDRRFLPGLESYEGMTSELQSILDRLSAKDPDFKCRMSVVGDSVMCEGFVHTGFFTPPEHPLCKAALGALTEVSGENASFVPCRCWTDAGLFSHYAHIPSVIFGPGNMGSSHSVREYLPIDELATACKVYIRTAVDFCGE